MLLTAFDSAYKAIHATIGIVKDFAEKEDTMPLNIAMEIRFTKHSTSPMSPAYGREVIQRSTLKNITNRDLPPILVNKKLCTMTRLRINPAQHIRTNVYLAKSRDGHALHQAQLELSVNCPLSRSKASGAQCCFNASGVYCGHGNASPALLATKNPSN